MLKYWSVVYGQIDQSQSVLSLIGMQQRVSKYCHCTVSDSYLHEVNLPLDYSQTAQKCARVLSAMSV